MTAHESALIELRKNLKKGLKKLFPGLRFVLFRARVRRHMEVTIISSGIAEDAAQQEKAKNKVEGHSKIVLPR